MTKLLEQPSGPCRTFLDFPLATDLETLQADVAILGIPFGMPYSPDAMANDQSRAPDAIRGASEHAKYTVEHFDWDLGGPLLNDSALRVVDCGNVTADMANHAAHYERAEAVSRQLFKAGITPVILGGDHGIPIPVLRALEETGERDITLVHIDAHLDWRDEVNGEPNGYSSPIRRASEMDHIGHIVQIGIRGIGSARTGEVEAAQDYGADIVSAYELHDIGMKAVLDRIPSGGPYYLTIDADGLDPTIMPAVMAQTPGGVTWFQMWQLIHGLFAKGTVLGMDLVELAPSRDVGVISMIHAERILCNFIGAVARSGRY